jgi:hypothetical protein
MAITALCSRFLPLSDFPEYDGAAKANVGRGGWSPSLIVSGLFSAADRFGFSSGSSSVMTDCALLSMIFICSSGLICGMEAHPFLFSII